MSVQDVLDRLDDINVVVERTIQRHDSLLGLSPRSLRYVLMVEIEKTCVDFYKANKRRPKTIFMSREIYSTVNRFNDGKITVLYPKVSLEVVFHERQKIRVEG